MRTSKTLASETLSLENIESVLFYLQLREHLSFLTESGGVEKYEDINFNDMRVYKMEAVNQEVARAMDSGESAFDCLLRLANEETKQINNIALHPSSPIISETISEMKDLTLNDVYVDDADLELTLAKGSLLDKSTEYLISFLETY